MLLASNDRYLPCHDKPGVSDSLILVYFYTIFRIPKHVYKFSIIFVQLTSNDKCLKQILVEETHITNVNFVSSLITIHAIISIF